MKKIIIFGASGDIGKYFVKYFLDNYSGTEYELIAVGTRDTDFFKSNGVEYIKVDIRNEKNFCLLPNDVYAVVDLAGAMPARMEGYDPRLYIDTNITGTFNILEYCRKNKVDRILYSQSFGDIKDNAENDILLKVDSPRKFSFRSDHTVYVLTKNFAVDMIENYHQMYGLKRFIFRLPTIYLWSPIDLYYVDGIKRKIGYRLLIEKAINGDDIEIWGDPSRKKDMVYVKDFCQMLYKALFVDRHGGYYNVGTGVGTTLEAQVLGIVDVFCDRDKRSQITYRKDMPDAFQYVMDISSAKAELGYEPVYDYIAMLKDMKATMNNNIYS